MPSTPTTPDRRPPPQASLALGARSPWRPLASLSRAAARRRRSLTARWVTAVPSRRLQAEGTQRRRFCLRLVAVINGRATLP